MKRFFSSALWTWVIILLALLCLLAGNQQIQTVQHHQERLDQCTNLARAFNGLEEGLWNLEVVLEARRTDSSPEVQQRMIQDLVRLKKSVRDTQSLPAMHTENQGALIRLDTVLILLERNLSLESFSFEEGSSNLRRAQQEVRSASARLWQQYRDVAVEITNRWQEVNLLVLLSCLLAAFLAFLLRSYHRDLMERKEAERALRESEDRYRSLVEVSPDSILVHRDGKVLFVNSTAVAMFGAESARAMLGLDLASLTAPGNSCMKRLDGTIMDVETVSTDFAYQDHPAVQMVIRDISDIRRQSEALAATERRYRTLFENVSEGVYRSTPDGRILEANPALVRLLGFKSLDELRTTTIDRDLYVDPPARAAAVARLQASGSLNNYELRLRHRDGSILTLLENARIVTAPDGSVECYEGTLTDISHIKQVEAALVHARDEALHVSRLKSEFLANVSHEIRTPMNGIIGMSELLRDTPLSVEQSEYADAVTRSARFLMNIINDVLDFSKIEAGRVDLEDLDFDLRESVEDVIELLAEQAHEKDLTFGAIFDPSLSSLYRGDPYRFQQVLTNLVGNAIKFTPSGEVLVRISAPGQDQLELEVLDSGIGIHPVIRPRLFQPFTQGDGSTTRRFGGTGLGLAISRQLVELMGGEIGVDNRASGGSRFWLRLPLPAVAPPLSRPPQCAGRALVALPPSPLRELVLEELSSRGVTVTEASDVQHFLLLAGDAAAQASPFAFSLIHGQWIGSADLSAIPNLLRFIRIRDRASAVHNAANGITLSDPCRRRVLVEAIDRLAAGVNHSASLLDLSRHIIAEAQSQASARPRVLIAEDNAINQRVALRMLEKLGIDADIAENGALAVETIQQCSYPLVLMDCQMPEMDGFEATARIRQWESTHHLPRIPIIAMTAHAMPGDRERCLAAGMDDYLSKPISLSALEQVLCHWIEVHREHPASLSSATAS